LNTLNVEYRKVEALIPYARNPRTHAESQIAKIAASIVEYGWTNPILVDGDNGIIAGHGRLAAARKLGLDQVPVMPQNMAEVREFIEFAVSIAFSFITGAWAARWLQRRAALKAEQQAQAKLARGATVNGQKVADSLSRLNDIGSAVVGVATTAISIYTGLKDFLGN